MTGGCLCGEIRYVLKGAPLRGPARLGEAF